MLNDRLTEARVIAAQLHTTEAEIESALLHSYQLAVSIVEGRRKARLPITIGQQSLVELSHAIEALVRARGSIGASHAALAEDRVNTGLRAFGMGDLTECPSTAMGDKDSTVVALHEKQVA
jgi:hypothetical protein